MPIEIKELYIKINVDESEKSQGGGKSSEHGKIAIIAACVEEVMERIKEQKER
ncbi:DUF5908 family protein [Mariniflexile sp. AS56]|uniref:DUF5908 family protein n=1 Tax=Mariniflexile sp. AS56 TaxID=3063957 RepID=UPI0026EAD9C4|nr:DUF5908 family protein [Mariniflexile sp. AS56]MDO7174065.1 DUF5908 family protein [Mariniflexile sp. AS56]